MLVLRTYVSLIYVIRFISQIFFRFQDGYRRVESPACRPGSDREGKVHSRGDAGAGREGHSFQCHQDRGQATTTRGYEAN